VLTHVAYISSENQALLAKTFDALQKRFGYFLGSYDFKKSLRINLPELMKAY